MFGVYESMLTGSISNKNVFVNGFSPEPFRSDKVSTTSNVCVCLYFKDTLALKQRCDLKILPRTIATEIKLNRNKDFITYIHNI